MEIAVRHELDARQAYFDLADGAHNSTNLMREFAASLVAVTAAAYTIEAVYGDVIYLIPNQRSRGKRHKDLRRAFRIAFGIREKEDRDIGGELAWLFDLRDQAAHPFTETLPAAAHPAGLHSGVENSLFNAVENTRAVDAAMEVLRFAADPPQPYGRWVNVRGAPYHARVVDPLRAMRAVVPRPEPV